MQKKIKNKIIGGIISAAVLSGVASGAYEMGQQKFITLPEREVVVKVYNAVIQDILTHCDEEPDCFYEKGQPKVRINANKSREIVEKLSEFTKRYEIKVIRKK